MQNLSLDIISGFLLVQAFRCGVSRVILLLAATDRRAPRAGFQVQGQPREYHCYSNSYGVLRIIAYVGESM